MSSKQGKVEKKSVELTEEQLIFIKQRRDKVENQRVKIDDMS